MKEKEGKLSEQTPLDPPLTGEQKRIAILHDAFLYRGGGERLVTLMAKALDADLVSGFFSNGSFDPRELGFTGKMIALGKPVFAKGLRHAVLKSRFLYKTKFLNEYDIVIFSGNCLDAARNIAKTTKKIYYCHTPPRYIFDFRDRYMARFPQWLHTIADRVLDREARAYIRELSEMDHIFTNSRNVHDRLLSFCGYESEILYPPTDVMSFAPSFRHREEGSDPGSGKQSMDCFVPRNDGDDINSFFSIPYFLSFARLSSPKRVDLIVDTFLEMGDQHLILTYGKNDPMRDEILEKISGKMHIRAIESPNDTDLIALIQGAIATIYIPIDEDFGMSPVESMACGTPVIGVDEGGLRETIIQNKTGKLIQIPDTQQGIQNLKKAIQETPQELWGSMRNDCILRAHDFSLEKFQERLQSSLSSHL